MHFSWLNCVLVGFNSLLNTELTALLDILLNTVPFIYTVQIICPLHKKIAMI